MIAGVLAILFFVTTVVVAVFVVKRKWFYVRLTAAAVLLSFISLGVSAPTHSPQRLPHINVGSWQPIVETTPVELKSIVETPSTPPVESPADVSTPPAPQLSPPAGQGSAAPNIFFPQPQDSAPVAPTSPGTGLTTIPEQLLKPVLNVLR